MFLLENVPLSSYSTMRLGGKARYLTEINDRSEVEKVVTWAEAQNLPIIMIGTGSNIVWGDKGFNGLVMVNKIMGFEVQNETETDAFVTIGAGESWDGVVERIVKLGYSGVEELSLIPGTTGATPVQNVGAYGREISETLATLTAYDKTTKQLVTLRGSDCQFGYRASRFKTTDRGRFFITSITLHVTKDGPKQPFYQSVQRYFADHGIGDRTIQAVRDAVIAIRTAKLPDPAKVANNGSFFENPIIDEVQGKSLIEDYPDLAYWRLDDGSIKISAAWLVEHAGFKDVHDEATGMATWANQPLVLVNEHATSTANLLAFRQKIIDSVAQKFGITLKQEPEYIEV